MVYARSAVLTQADGGRWSFFDRPPIGDSRWYLEDIAGWYGGSGVRGEVTAALGHGDFVERGYREGRSLTLHGAVACATADLRDWQERSLSGVAGDGDWGELTADDGSAVLSTKVRLDGAPQIVKVGTTKLRFQIPLRSESPFLHSPWRETALQPIGAGVGLTYDLFSGGLLSFGTAVSTDEWIWNEGNTESTSVFTVTANAPGGFWVAVDDRRVTYPQPTFPDVPVVVDMAGSVLVAGVDQSHLLGERSWAATPPGGVSTVEFGFLQGGTGFGTVRHRDTYI